MDDTAGSDGTYLINDHTYAFLSTFQDDDVLRHARGGRRRRR